MIRSHSCLTNGFHIVHETTREFVNKLPISDHKENDPTLCIIVFSLHISILKHPQSVHNHTVQYSNINVSPLLTFHEGTRLMAADGYLFKHIDLKDKDRFQIANNVCHIFYLLILVKPLQKLDKHRMCFLLTQENCMKEVLSFHSVED